MRPDKFLKRAETTTPAIVLNGESVGLGVARDLGRHGVPVLALNPRRRGSAQVSRYTAALPCTDPRASEDQLIEELDRLGARLPQRGVLFPVHDDYVFAVSRHKEYLERSFILPVMSWDRMRILADKERQVRLAWLARVDTPHTAFIDGPDDLATATDAVPFPAILKPAVPSAFIPRAGWKAYLLERPDQLRDAYESGRFAGSFLLQEIIPGRHEEIVMAGTYHDAASRCVALFTGRKLRQHPPHFGVTRLGESHWSPELAEVTLRLLDAVHYQGVSDVEFKRDPRDGRFKFIEINARQGLWAPLATAAGVNLSYIAYSDLTGRPSTVGRQRDGVRWSDSLRDVHDSVRELRRGELGLGEWLGPLPGIRADEFFSLRDPLPAAHELARMGRKVVEAVKKVRQ
jgi:D-aspartate ligase